MSVRDDRHDVAVVGVGGIGSATVYHLADRGSDVVGLEYYDILHSQGLSHGIIRIIRRTYYEHPSYVPLVERAHDLWNDLADETGRDIIRRTGSVDAGPIDNDVFMGLKRPCEEHDIPHEVLTGAEVNERFSGYELSEDYRAVYQEDSGFVVPEQSIIGYTEAAQTWGAEIRVREWVEDWAETDDGGVCVRTNRGVYVVDALVLTAGVWNYKPADAFDGLATPERQAFAWSQPESPVTSAPEEFPVWNLSVPEGRFYGFPAHNVSGFKLGKYHYRDEEVDPDDFDREPNRADEAILRDVMEKYFPEAVGPTMPLVTCMFTSSLDKYLIFDTLPDHPQIVVGAGFSGYGFKFASVIGEILADRVDDGESNLSLDMSSLDRFE